MLTRLIIFCFYINILNVNAQTTKVKIKNQKDFKYFWIEYIDSALIIPPNFDTCNVELRIWRLVWGDGHHSMLRLTENKQGHWNGIASEFYYYNPLNNDLTPHKQRQISIKSSWINDWKSILYKKYLNLKTQKEVDKIYKDKLNEFLSVADGGGLRIEIITKNRKRSFEYNNAKAHYDFYREHGFDISEYKRFLELEAILNRNFKDSK
jgi:hypothetical protein